MDTGRDRAPRAGTPQQVADQAGVRVDVARFGDFVGILLLRGEATSRERRHAEIEMAEQACRKSAVLEAIQSNSVVRLADVDVRRSEVSVNEPGVVRSLDRLADSNGQPQGGAHVNGRIRREPVVERASRDEIGDEQEVAFRGVLDVEGAREG
jgi:hypothetical protein